MPIKPDLRRVMVIGSGPIVIGQAAEFDYAGTQACRALKEEGLEVVLVNNNGMKQKDIRCAEMVLEENKELAIAKWNEYFGSSLSGDMED